MAWIAALGGAAISYQGNQDALSAARDANAANLAYQQDYNRQVDPFSTSGSRERYV